MRKHNKLFVIGNGFDLAHVLKTGYSDFKNFLEGFDHAYSDHSSHENRNPLSGTPAHTIVCLVSNVLGNQWHDVELACGELILDDCFELWNRQTFPNDIDRGYTVSRDIANDILKRMITIRDYLSKWISTIDVSKARVIPSFKRLIRPNEDLFLTFNYTSTLELLYGAKNVLHIHGQLGSPLIFGHGNDNRDQYNYEYIAHGSTFGLSALHDNLRKDVARVIEDNATWFEELVDIDEIYSYGFSYAHVDLPYIKRICNGLGNTEKTVWYLNDFDDTEQRHKFQQSIQNCGFEGSFDTFEIKK